MMSVFLSIALFAITIIIILLMRISDNKTRSVANVKKLVEQIHSDVLGFEESLKQQVVDIEVRINNDTQQDKELMQTINAEISELKAYSEDFAALHDSMAKYKVALNALAKLTSDADERIESIKEEIDQIQKIRESFASFKGEIRNLEASSMNNVRDGVRSGEETLASKLNEVKSAVSSAVDEVKEVILDAKQVSIELAGKVEEAKRAASQEFEIQDMGFDQDFPEINEIEELDDNQTDI